MVNVDDRIEDAIALSRRTLLIGTASAIALAALPSVPPGDVAGVLRAESAANYARRHVSEILFCCEGATEDAAVMLNLMRNSEVVHATAINVRGFYRWKAFSDEELILMGGDYVKLVVEPVVPKITYRVMLTVYDMDYDGYWLPFVESHTLPGGLPTLDRMTFDPPSLEGPDGRVWKPVPLPKVIDPRDLPPAHYRNLDL